MCPTYLQGEDTDGPDTVLPSVRVQHRRAAGALAGSWYKQRLRPCPAASEPRPTLEAQAASHEVR
jgi:hypothetical protein